MKNTRYSTCFYGPTPLKSPARGRAIHRLLLAVLLPLCGVFLVHSSVAAQAKGKGKALCVTAEGGIVMGSKRCETPLTANLIAQQAARKIDTKELVGPRGPQGEEGPRGKPGEKGSFSLASCQKTSATKESSDGIVTLSLACPSTTQFMMNDGYWIQSQYDSDVYTRYRELLFSGSTPSGVTLSLGTFDDEFTLHLDIVCCSQ